MMLNCENGPKIAKVVFPCFSERCHGNMCNLNDSCARIHTQGPIPAICNTSLVKIPKFNSLPTYEAEIRPLT